MGLSSSQARLLTLTGRMHDIERKAQKIQADKLRLANDSRRAYDNYLIALDSQKLQYQTIMQDGSIAYEDATLAALENGSVSSYSGAKSSKTFLLQNAQTGEIFVTPEFAAQYGITNSGTTSVGTLEEFLTANDAEKEEVMETVTNYNDVSNIHGVNNGFVAGQAAPDTIEYSVLGTFTPASVDSVSGAQYIVTANTMPTMSVTACTTSSATSQNKLGDYIFGNATYNYFSTPYTLSLSTNIKDLLFSNKQNARDGYGDLIYKGSSNIDFHYTPESDLDNLTIQQYFEYVKNNNPAGYFDYQSNSDGSFSFTTKQAVSSNYVLPSLSTKTTNADGSVTYTIPAGTTYNKLQNQTYSFTTAELNSTMEELSNSKGWNIDFSATNEITRGYMNHVVNGIGAISAGATHISDKSSYAYTSSTTLREILQWIDGDTSNATFSESGSSGTLTVTNGYVYTSSSDTPAGGGSVTSKGSITNTPSTTDIKEYFALQMYNNNISGPSYDEHLTYLNSLGYNDYQWASIYYKKDDALTTKLYNHDAINSYIDSTWDTTHYNLTQSTDDNYVVENAVSTTATSPSKADIILKLAEKMNEQDSSKNINEYKTQLESYFNSYNNNQMASISSHYNNATEWADIALKLRTGGNISSYTSDLNGYTVTMSTNALTLHDETIEGEVGKDTIQVPTLEGIASNLVVAFRKAGYENIDENFIKQKLESLYGTANDSNNATLANINKCAYDYLSGTGSVTSLYNHIYNNATLSIPATYTATSNLYERKNLGKASATYGTKQQGTGVKEWKKDSNYYSLVAQYNSLKQLDGNKYVIVDADIAESTEFVNNYIESNLGVFIEFNAGQEVEDMKQTSVAIETSLRDVSDEKDVRKAEAQYEADMRKIDKKDRQYDVELAKFDNERNAIKSEIETLKNVAKDNVERTFKLFG